VARRLVPRMKTILFVAANPIHRRLYEPGLAKHFAVQFAERLPGHLPAVDAIVYDLEDVPPSLTTDSVGQQGMPVVFLTSKSQASLRMPRSRTRSILTYPVRMGDILQALARLGVPVDGRTP
jgi:hypothetical protein